MIIYMNALDLIIFLQSLMVFLLGYIAWQVTRPIKKDRKK